MVTIALANSVEWFVAFAACWKIGAIPQPVSARLPAPELQAILELADPPLVIGVRTELDRGPSHLARRVPARSGASRRPAPRCHLPGMEGAHLRGARRDGPS